MNLGITNAETSSCFPGARSLVHSMNCSANGPRALSDILVITHGINANWVLLRCYSLLPLARIESQSVFWIERPEIIITYDSLRYNLAVDVRRESPWARNRTIWSSKWIDLLYCSWFVFKNDEIFILHRRLGLKTVLGRVRVPRTSEPNSMLVVCQGRRAVCCTKSEPSKRPRYEFIWTMSTRFFRVWTNDRAIHGVHYKKYSQETRLVWKLKFLNFFEKFSK